MKFLPFLFLPILKEESEYPLSIYFINDRMKSFSIYKTIYFIGIVFIFLGAYRLYKQFSFGDFIFATGILFYSGVQIKLIFRKKIKDWTAFEYLKLAVNLLFLTSLFSLIVMRIEAWHYPFVLGILVDFFANIFRRIKKN